jgi:hypothetical protein
MKENCCSNSLGGPFGTTRVIDIDFMSGPILWLPIKGNHGTKLSTTSYKLEQYRKNLSTERIERFNIKFRCLFKWVSFRKYVVVVEERYVVSNDGEF